MVFELNRSSPKFIYAFVLYPMTKKQPTEMVNKMDPFKIQSSQENTYTAVFSEIKLLVTREKDAPLQVFSW